MNWFLIVAGVPFLALVYFFVAEVCGVRETIQNKRRSNPFKEQMGQIYTYSVDEETSSYAVLCNGVPLKWKIFRPALGDEKEKHKTCGILDWHRDYGWFVNERSSDVYDKRYGRERDLPSIVWGYRYVEKTENFLHEPCRDNIKLGSKEEAEKLIRIMDLGYHFVDAVMSLSELFPAVWYDSDNQSWVSGVATKCLDEDSINNDKRWVQFIPLEFVTDEELDYVEEERRKYNREEPNPDDGEIITSRKPIDI